MNNISSLSREWLLDDTSANVIFSPAILAVVREFVMARWVERAAERREPVPRDLSGACKFSSLFIKMVFGGRILGNSLHQFNVLHGHVVDLNADCDDVMAMPAPYRHDPLFFGNPEHVEAMESCLPRVSAWVMMFNSIPRPVHSSLSDTSNGP